MQRKKKTGKKEGEEEEGKRKGEGRRREPEEWKVTVYLAKVPVLFRKMAILNGLTKKQDYNTQIKIKSSDAVSFNNFLILKELNM